MASSSTPDIKVIVGPILIAVTIKTFLYGICFLQFIWYFMAGTRDRLLMKLFVYWELLVNTFHTALSVYIIWQYVVNNFTNETFLKTGSWPLISTGFMTACSACPIQIYLAYCVKIVSGSWIVFAVLLALTLAEGSLMIVSSTVLLLRAREGASRFVPAVDSWAAFTAATDIAINVSLIFYLRKSRTGSRRTDHVISRLIRAAIETASFGSFFSVMLLITFTLWPALTINTVFSIPLGGVYANTFLAILNSRESLRKELHDNPRLSSTSSSPSLPESFTTIRMGTQNPIVHQSGAAPSIVSTRTTTDSQNSSIVLTDFESLQLSFYSTSSVHSKANEPIVEVSRSIREA
ncbi:hypothetical protein GYMLUDRAFT_41750 [Collybiopsis luxurians FD-317 M1]|uniref:DUF6534 domain-containing protein n=1 Tax=Collybiopsis luxurians FD-317 M1 TaxID=944289 RepID=A0A0D0D1A9_9AGAR|nr:hypothetical protein GYMLUDRAFT_41750 [Collybiopsis luxurians FD-317 M1]